MALLLLLLATAGAASAEEPNICRELPVSAIPGETITVILNITLDGADKTVIEDKAPTGWVLSNSSDDGSIINTNTVNWINMNSAPATSQFTYDVTIPENTVPGTYIFEGEFDLSTTGLSINPLDCGDTQINVGDTTSENTMPLGEQAETDTSTPGFSSLLVIGILGMVYTILRRRN